MFQIAETFQNSLSDACRRPSFGMERTWWRGNWWRLDPPAVPFASNGSVCL